VELYKRLRPKSFKEVVGQPEAVKTLQALCAGGKLPRAILLTGQSGVGKTTLARILRAKLRCDNDFDYLEVNAANTRGIEMARKVEKFVAPKPMFAPVRVALLDEVHQVTKEAQSALLKTLEDTPKHAHILLATTEPGKLLRTIVTRCTEIKLKALDGTALSEIITTAAGHTKAGGVEDAVLDRIVEAADGSARKALVILDQIAGLKTEEEQLEAIQKADTRRAAFDLVKVLMPFKGPVVWASVADVLKGLEHEDAEGVRKLILSVCKTHMLSNNGMADRSYAVFRRFQYNLYDSGFCGLVASCREVFVDALGSRKR
jgi:DNA polymerase-3 subunit gamma/tau